MQWHSKKKIFNKETITQDTEETKRELFKFIYDFFQPGTTQVVYDLQRKVADSIAIIERQVQKEMIEKQVLGGGVGVTANEQSWFKRGVEQGKMEMFHIINDGILDDVTYTLRKGRHGLKDDWWSGVDDVCTVVGNRLEEARDFLLQPNPDQEDHD